MTLILLAAAYLVGSIPSGVLVARLLRLQDPRTAGSGNIGATNMLRLGGKTAGILTLIGDYAKGVVAVNIAQTWLSPGPAVWACALAAVVGHMFSAFLRIRGGKGIATGFGVLTPLWPWIVAGLLGIWLLVAVIWRYSSLAGLIAFLSLPVILWVVTRDTGAAGFGLILAGLIWVRHQENIRRLLAGKESRMGGNAG